MTTQQQIDALNNFSEHWEQGLRNLTQGRDELLAWQNGGLLLLDKDGKDELPALIEEAEDAIQRVLRIVTEIEALRERAARGEDV